MKLFTILVAALTGFGCSVFWGIDGSGDTSPAFATIINNKPFELQQDQLLRGIVMNKTGSIDGRVPARTVISATFNGPSYDISEGRLFNENIQMELNYEPEHIGSLKYYSMAVRYMSGSYYLLGDESKLKITRFDWESDRKHFLLSADYNCKLRSWGAPTDGKRDIYLSGSFTNLRITVPSWVTIKN